MRLIDADELKKVLESSKYIVPNNLNRLLNSEINRCIEAIDNAPTVEPDMAQVLAYENGKASAERPQGEWIATQVIGISEITLTCSNCKDEFIGENDIDTWKFVYHYCPSCGAYMVEDMREGEAE